MTQHKNTKYGRKKPDKSDRKESIKRRKNFEGIGHNYYGIWEEQTQMLKESRSISRDATEALPMQRSALTPITQRDTTPPCRLNVFAR